MRKKQISRRSFLNGIGLIMAGMSTRQNAANSRELQDQGSPAEKSTKKIGIALGGGGAKALAHIPMLEALDELGVKPHLITGCSMGAVIGALYASGLSGSDIRHFIDNLVATKNESWPEALIHKDILEWIKFIDPELGAGGLIDGENFIQYLHKEIQVKYFSELKIPLRIVAADFWEREQVILDQGKLLPAIKASMTFPGLFVPAKMDGRILMDGGLVNPVPYDLLLGECDITIAVDVTGSIPVPADSQPSFFDSIFNSIHIMQETIIKEKLKNRQPDIFIRPAINGIRMLEFYKAKTVYRQAAPAKDDLKRALENLLS